MSVLIVGAGPTGLTAAMELSRLGVPVRLIDRAEGPSSTSRALAVQARTIELLEPRGVGAEMLRLGNPARATALYGRGRRLAAVDLSRTPSRVGGTVLLPQSETERLLREQLGRQGVQIEWGVERASVDSAAFDHVIAADGAHSAIRHELGLGFEGRSLPQAYALADVALDGELPEDELSIFLGAGAFLAVFPMGGRRYRLMASDSPSGSERSADAPAVEELQAVYDQVSPVPGRLHDMAWSSRFRISSRHVSTLRVGKVFLAGDAAHVHSPAGGQGMNTGIQEMINLSWKLAAVQAGRAAPELLDTYEAERLPVIRALVGTTERATAVFAARGALTHRVRTAVLPLLLGRAAVQRTGSRTVSQVGIGYRRSPLSAPGRGIGGLRAGDRIPDLSLTDGGRLATLVGCTGPTLLAIGTDAPDLGRWRDVAAVAPVSLAAEQPAQLAADQLTAALSRGALVLARPDGYAAVVAAAGGAAAVTGWLARWYPHAAAPAEPATEPAAAHR